MHSKKIMIYLKIGEKMKGISKRESLNVWKKMVLKKYRLDISICESGNIK